MSSGRRPAAFWVLVVLLAAEFALVAALAVTLVVELLVARATSLPTAIALTVLAFLAAIWLGAIVVGALRGRAWIRGAAIVWQVLQFAVGAASITGQFAQPAWGWPLVITALVAFGLLMSRPVVEAVATRPDPGA
ncbi:MAG: hypothetical protein KF727_02335 [Microbacteriaceae bacterium]|nr:hypothetical protein [Microbacteriaceae bacterium]